MKEHQKKGALKQRTVAPLYTLYWGFKKISCKVCLMFYCFLVIKRILKVLFSFNPWLLNSSYLPCYGSNSRKRHTLRLLLMSLGRTPRGNRSPPPFDTFFDSLRWAPFINLYKNCLLVSKITWGIWTTSGKQWKLQKVEIRWATFVQKIISFS